MNKLRHYFMTMMALIAISSQAQVTPVSQMEKLDRGLVAVPTSTTACFVSWRFLGTDSEDTRFDVLRNGVTIATDLQVTNYTDKNASSEADYQVITKVNGEVKETSKATKAWTALYKQLKLDRPAKGALGGTYSSNDCSVGDVDGDGEYEIFVKWDPSNSKDNSQGDKTDNVYIDCYKLDVPSSGALTWVSISGQAPTTPSSKCMITTVTARQN